MTRGVKQSHRNIETKTDLIATEGTDHGRRIEALENRIPQEAH